MAFLRKLLARFLPATIPYALVVLLAGVLLHTASVSASQVTVTLSGTTTGSGLDTTGVFVAPGASLAGYNFTLTYIIDDSKGIPYLGTYPACSNGKQDNGVTDNPIQTGVLTINGRSYQLNQPPAVTMSSFAASENATTPKMRLSGQLTPAYAGSPVLFGSEIMTYTISINSTQVCRNWESSYNFSPVAGTDSTSGTLQAGWGLGAPFVYTERFTTNALVSTITVSGPTSSPVLATTSGQNYSCPTCQCGKYQIAALKTDVCPNAANGDPINAGVGNMILSETDFIGPGNTHLSFVRSYNSLDTTDAGFGPGWHSTYHHGLTDITSTSVTVTDARGRQDVFTLSGGNWVPQANVTSVLVSTTSPSGYSLTLPDDSVENYNASGQLTSIVLRNGLTTSLTYSTTGLTTVTGPFGHALNFSFNALGKVTTMTLPNGTTKYGYGYDAFNNLSYVNNPDSTYRVYTHSGVFPSLITMVVDEDGNPYSSWTYDDTGRAISSQNAGGVNLTSLNYTSTGLVTATDALGNTTSYALTANYGLVQPAAVGGVPNLRAGGAAFTYDGNGFVASRTDYNGNVTQYTHNALGEELTRTEAYGTGLERTTTTTWHGTFHLPTRIDQPLNLTTTFGYDGNGNLLTRSVTDGVTVRTTSYTYDGNGLRTSMTDPLGHTTTWTYDGSGNVATMVNALGHVTTFNAYDGNGRLLRMTSPLGLVTTYAYDAVGRLTSKKVGGLLTSYAWDAGVGKVSTVTYPDSSTLRFGFDDAHRLIQIKLASNDNVQYVYDDNSNVVNVSVYDSASALKATHTYAYDSQNRVANSIGAAMGETTTYGYDDQGNLLRVTDALGNTTSYTYDALNRLKTAVDALNNTTSYDYDALDNVVTVKDPLGLTTTYTWSAYGDVLTVASPDTGTTTNSYNAGGLVLTTTDSRGQGATYGYDALNRTTTVTYAGGPTIGYLYDTTTNGIGSLGQMTDPAGTTSWAYDQFSRVTRKSQQTGALTLTTTYGYDSSGRLQTIKYPSAKTVTYSYDSSGRVNNLNFSNVNLNAITYFPFGPAKSWNHPNATAVTRAFDQDGRLTGTTLNGTTTNVQTVTYDVAGRITALSETATVFASSHTYGYDNLNRLTSFFNGTTTTSYTYDANGNRLTSTLSGTTTYNYPGTSNRLTSLTGTTTASYGYDALGNTTSDGANVWTYDARGRMSTLVAGTTTASYSINGFGQRIAKSGNTVPNGGTNEYVYDEMGNLIGEYGSTGTAVQEIVWLPDTPVPVLSGGFGMAGLGQAIPVTALSGTTSYYPITTDQTGAPHIIADPAKQLRWTWQRNPFADNAPNQNPKGLGTFTHNLRLLGQFADAESGMNYNYFRDCYNPATGRYCQADPIGLAGGQFSLYPYVYNNPLTFVDSNGLQLARAGGGNPLFIIITTAATLICEAIGQIINNSPPVSIPDDGLPQVPKVDTPTDGKVIPPPPPVVQSPPLTFGPLSPECAAAKDECIAECSDSSLPTGPLHGFPFWNCVNACMEARGCGS